MEPLTEKEEQIMRIFWDLKKAFVNDVIVHLPAPQPPYTTVSSIVRTLEKKGYLSHKAYGKIHEYYPLIGKLSYKKIILRNVISRYFDNSFENVVSFMASQKELSEKEMADIKKLIDENEKANE